MIAFTNIARENGYWVIPKKTEPLQRTDRAFLKWIIIFFFCLLFYGLPNINSKTSEMMIIIIYQDQRYSSKRFEPGVVSFLGSSSFYFRSFIHSFIHSFDGEIKKWTKPKASFCRWVLGTPMERLRTIETAFSADTIVRLFTRPSRVSVLIRSEGARYMDTGVNMGSEKVKTFRGK